MSSSESAFCAACGNATCSPECHHKYFENTNLCSFHEHFAPEEPLVSLRSLTLENIQFAEKERLAVGTPLNRTSRSYFFGMAHPEKHKIYVQRGFRQYGDIGVSSSGPHLQGLPGLALQQP